MYAAGNTTELGGGVLFGATTARPDTAPCHRASQYVPGFSVFTVAFCFSKHNKHSVKREKRFFKKEMVVLQL